ncbi:MAG: hypothetical protein HQ558_06750 [Candidatus Omnitrophica bacterium]|nr:hypothetical protein [Candidatus Omnitrophota bacterium]
MTDMIKHIIKLTIIIALLIQASGVGLLLDRFSHESALRPIATALIEDGPTGTKAASSGRFPQELIERVARGIEEDYQIYRSRYLAEADELPGHIWLIGILQFDEDMNVTAINTSSRYLGFRNGVPHPEVYHAQIAQENRINPDEESFYALSFYFNPKGERPTRPIKIAIDLKRPDRSLTLSKIRRDYLYIADLLIAILSELGCSMQDISALRWEGNFRKAFSDDEIIFTETESVFGLTKASVLASLTDMAALPEELPESFVVDNNSGGAKTASTGKALKWVKDVEVVVGKPEKDKEQIRFISGESHLGLTCSQKVQYKDDICWVKMANMNIDEPDEEGRVILPARIIKRLNSKGVRGIPRVLRLLELKDKRKVALYERLEAMYGHGEALDEKIKLRPQELTREKMFHIMIEVSNIVKALLDEGVYHWDIKPSNIWISNKGDVVLVDFDLVFSSTEEYYAKEAWRFGSLVFASAKRLEMFESQPMGIPFSPRDEIYSLGMTFINMLMGNALLKEGRYVSPSLTFDWARMLDDLRPQVEPAIYRVVSNTVTSHGESRYDNIDRFIKALEGARDQICGTKSASSGRQTDTDKDYPETVTALRFNTRPQYMVELPMARASDLDKGDRVRAFDSLDRWLKYDADTKRPKAVHVGAINMYMEWLLENNNGLSDLYFIFSEDFGEVEGWLNLSAGVIEIAPWDRDGTIGGKKYSGVGAELRVFAIRKLRQYFGDKMYSEEHIEKLFTLGREDLPTQEPEPVYGNKFSTTMGDITPEIIEAYMERQRQSKEALLKQSGTASVSAQALRANLTGRPALSKIDSAA